MAAELYEYLQSAARARTDNSALSDTYGSDRLVKDIKLSKADADKPQQTTSNLSTQCVSASGSAFNDGRGKI